MNALRDILAVPFGWALGAIYDLSGNYLVALVIITVVLRLILLPSSIKQQKNSAKQMRLQAKANKIKAKYAGQGREAQMKISEETQELYRREGYNPATSGCLPLIGQLIVMMGLYGAIYSPITKVLLYSEHNIDNIIAALKSAYMQVMNLTELSGNELYRIELNMLNKFEDMVPLLDRSIVSDEIILKLRNFITNFNIFGIDLTANPDKWKELGATMLIVVPVLAGVTAMLTSVYTYLKQRKTNPEMAKNPAMGCMSFSSPLISVVFAYTLPAGVGFYWIISNILSFIQLVALSVAFKPADTIANLMIDETVERRSREQQIKKTKALLAAREETDIE